MPEHAAVEMADEAIPQLGLAQYLHSCVWSGIHQRRSATSANSSSAPTQTGTMWFDSGYSWVGSINGAKTKCNICCKEKNWICYGWKLLIRWWLLRFRLMMISFCQFGQSVKQSFMLDSNNLLKIMKNKNRRALSGKKNVKNLHLILKCLFKKCNLYGSFCRKRCRTLYVAISKKRINE